MKTVELAGAALDWAVAKCEGGTTNPLAFVGENRSKISESWATCGPIIEREKIRLDQSDHPEMWPWFANKLIGWEKRGEEELGDWPVYAEAGGDTPLIAAMRCFVASKLGEEVEVPEVLT